MQEDRFDPELLSELTRWAQSHGSGRANRSLPCSVVLDLAYRYPNHPLLGTARPEPARPTGAPTDPEVLRRIGSLVDEFKEHYQRVKGRAPRFDKVYTEDELTDAEERIGVRLPEDVRAVSARRC